MNGGFWRGLGLGLCLRSTRRRAGFPECRRMWCCAAALRGDEDGGGGGGGEGGSGSDQIGRAHV